MSLLLYASIFFWLIVGHSLCDYPLQGDFLARGKNHRLPIPGIPSWMCLAAHSAIHAGAVALATGSIILGLVEFGLHALIDFGKCSEWYGFDSDQCLHVCCKCLYIAALAGGLFR
jgi:hypothetical protein